MKIFFLIAFLLIPLAGNSAAQANTYKGVSFNIRLTDGKSRESRNTFAPGQEIVIETRIINKSDRAFPTGHDGGDDYMFKFTLHKMGETQPVAYRPDRAHTLKIRENTPCEACMRLWLDPIPAGDEMELSSFKLGDRYENLGPGDYTLTIEYRTLEAIKEKGKVVGNIRLTDSVSFTIEQGSKDN